MRSSCTEPGCELPVFGRGLCQRAYQLARYHGTLPVVPPPRRCEKCGETFQGRKWNARYCSRKCNDRARYDRTRKARYPDPVLACEHCGTEFEKKRIDARFCSDKCGQDWRNARTAAATLASKVNRPPCVVCDAKIPAEEPVTRIYCSAACKSRARRHEKYGLTREELKLLLRQHDRCAICDTDAWGKKGPCVDHDHETGRVRGILCGSCNQGLGRFRDDPVRLRAAADYLEAHSTS